MGWPSAGPWPLSSRPAWSGTASTRSAVRWCTPLAGSWSTRGTPCPARLWSRWVSGGPGPRRPRCHLVQMGEWGAPAPDGPRLSSRHADRPRGPGWALRRARAGAAPCADSREGRHPPDPRGHAGRRAGGGSHGEDTQVAAPLSPRVPPLGDAVSNLCPLGMPGRLLLTKGCGAPERGRFAAGPGEVRGPREQCSLLGGLGAGEGVRWGPVSGC